MKVEMSVNSNCNRRKYVKLTDKIEAFRNGSEKYHPTIYKIQKKGFK